MGERDAIASRRALRSLRSNTFVSALGLALALLIANAVVDPAFVSSGLPSTLGALAPLALVAMASTPAILSGGIDLSLGPLLSLANVMMVTSLLPNGLGSIWLSVPIVLALGAALGAINGTLIAVLRFPPVIATLCSLFVLLGAAYDLAPTPRAAGANWTSHLTGTIGGVPTALLIIAAPLLLWWLLRRTPFCRALYCVGDSDVTAFTAGVDVGLTRILAYALGGLIAALGGLALTGVVHSGDSSLGLQYTLIALAAVVLGGTPLGGGEGGMLGALFGAVSLFLIQNLLDALNVNPTWFSVVYGGVLIAAATVGGSLARSAARSAE
jgi:ribose transport system permease protein